VLVLAYCTCYIYYFLILCSLFFSFLFLTPVEIRQVLKCGRGCFNRLIDSTIQQVNCSMEISSFGWSLRNVATSSVLQYKIFAYIHYILKSLFKVCLDSLTSICM
jgi:hypothetical protein